MIVKVFKNSFLQIIIFCIIIFMYEFIKNYEYLYKNYIFSCLCYESIIPLSFTTFSFIFSNFIAYFVRITNKFINFSIEIILLVNS